MEDKEEILAVLAQARVENQPFSNGWVNTPDAIIHDHLVDVMIKIENHL